MFTVVDNQIRWANLVTLRDEWRTQEAENRKGSKQRKDKKDGMNGEEDSSDEEPAEDGSQNYRVTRPLTDGPLGLS